MEHSWYEEPAFITMLVIIYVMQIYWFVLVRALHQSIDQMACAHALAAQIVQVAVRALRDPSSTADVREEDNWNREEDEKKKKNKKKLA